MKKKGNLGGVFREFSFKKCKAWFALSIPLTIVVNSRSRSGTSYSGVFSFLWATTRRWPPITIFFAFRFRLSMRRQSTQRLSKELTNSNKLRQWSIHFRHHGRTLRAEAKWVCSSPPPSFIGVTRVTDDLITAIDFSIDWPWWRRNKETPRWNWKTGKCQMFWTCSRCKLARICLVFARGIHVPQRPFRQTTTIH